MSTRKVVIYWSIHICINCHYVIKKIFFTNIPPNYLITYRICYSLCQTKLSQSFEWQTHMRELVILYYCSDWCCLIAMIAYIINFELFSNYGIIITFFVFILRLLIIEIRFIRIIFCERLNSITKIILKNTQTLIHVCN